jgi:hypothetical protein
MKFRKTMLIIATVLVATMMTTSAMAYVLNARSEEMSANSYCDFAGTMTLSFGTADQTIIMNYLNGPDGAPGGGDDREFVLLRVSLSGTDFSPGSDVPLLCEDIQGGTTGVAAGYAGGDLPNNNLVFLDEIDVEVSNTDVGVDADIEAYVYGEDGDQYFEIYITDLDAAADWGAAAPEDRPFIKIGLYDELLAAAPGTDTTPICADVHDFDGLAKLTISIDNTPSDLTTTTSDNQIGHFLAEDAFVIADCSKTGVTACDFGVPPAAAGVPATTEIELCDNYTLDANLQGVQCQEYYHCFTVTGDYPISGNIEFEITSDMLASEAAQTGVYLANVDILSDGVEIGGDAIYNGVGGAFASCSLVGGSVSYVTCTSAILTVDAALIVSNTVQVCITYLVDVSAATADTNATFWATASVLPCGELFRDASEGASLVECGTIPYCVYMPYVLTQTGSWNTGIAIANLGSAVAPADMEVTFTITDSTGTQFTYTKDDFTTVTFAAYLDNMLTEFSGTPAAGAAWLLIQANFTIDAYQFLTDGTFGAGTLARPLSSCMAVMPTP